MKDKPINNNKKKRTDIPLGNSAAAVPKVTAIAPSSNAYPMFLAELFILNIFSWLLFLDVLSNNTHVNMYTSLDLVEALSDHRS